ncbi:uncharacterized protein JCM10292_003770 [Rhodotorula paludigena]|uniref:uncharacterized protein n=1 Tax=Rhodotorula paludigena TaxID=86838 RepID=UPI003172C5BA
MSAADHSAQLAGLRSGILPASIPTQHSLSASSSASSASSSSSQDSAIPPWRAGHDPSPHGVSSTNVSTAITSPASSSPVSPFSSPLRLAAPASLDAHTLASAEEGHSPVAPAEGAVYRANGNGSGSTGAHGRERYSKMSDVDAEDARVARKLAQQHKAAQNEEDDEKLGDKEADEWDELLSQAKQAGRLWKKTWEKEGWNGILARLRRTRTPSLGSARRALTSSPRFASARSLFAVIPPRRRALFLVTVTLIILFLLFSPSASTPSSTPSPHGRLRARRGRSSANALAVLTSTTMSSALRPKGYPQSANKAKVVESISNPYGFINLVDPYSGGVFNPSLLVLPDQAGLGWRHLLVARGEEKYELIQGEDTRWEKVVGCFMLPLKRAHLDLPYLARESELTTLDLPAERKVPYHRCDNPDFNQFVGAEDPRLFFRDDGQPLMVYSQTGRSPNICRALYIIDARVVIPGLDKALKKAGWNPPIEFREQTDLIREGQYNIEKNWSGFMGQNDELMFHVSLVPQEIYKWVPNMTLRPLNPLAPSHNCLTDILGNDMNRVHLHHATPLLRATLCRRGECKPDVHNTVLFGIIHVKYHPLPYLHYVRHVVTWNVTEPYEYISVSRPLTYSGTNQADPIFTVSMAWDHPTDRYGLGLNHGFLDDSVLISFGVADYGSGYTDVLAHDLLTDHQLCSGVGGTSLWS